MPAADHPRASIAAALFVSSNHGHQAPFVLYSAEAASPHPLVSYASHASAALRSCPITTIHPVAGPTAPIVDIPTSLLDASQQLPCPYPLESSHVPTIEIKSPHGASDLSSKEPAGITGIQMKGGKRISFALASTVLGLFTASQVYQHTHQQGGSEGLEETEWIGSSRSWLGRKGCRWFGFCGITHLNRSNWGGKKVHKIEGDAAQTAMADGHKVNPGDFWKSGKSRPEAWSDDERALREIPQYVLDHAPLMHLFSDEQFWPCDIANHLIHTTPHLNYTPIQPESDHPTLDNLNELNDLGLSVYLQSDDNVEQRPAWLGGKSNVPAQMDDGDEDGQTRYADWDGRVDGKLPDEHERSWYEAGMGDTDDKGGGRANPSAFRGATPIDTVEGEELVYEDEPRMLRRTLDWWSADGRRGSPGGRSKAPAVLIVVDKGHGVVDAFWFYFYSYNLGNIVLNVRFGNHVGDWEHCVVRFHHGQPKAVFFSEHNFGEAYAWEAVEKIGRRPVGYVASGTHAMYATAGTHAYILPWGLLHDITDRGPLWDPLLNVHSYTYQYQNDTLKSSTMTPRAPSGWFYFHGHWGDKFYPLSDPRQYRFAGQYHYYGRRGIFC